MLPKALVGLPHLGSHICDEWELRVTARCLEDDLKRPTDSNFEELTGIEIVKALVKDRSHRAIDTRRVAPLTCGEEVWVLSRGNDHRGATWHDSANRVVWLVACGRHRSGTSDDFFPYCKALDEDDTLLPAEQDYERLILDRDLRFAYAIRVEAPLVLKTARETPGEHNVMLGGQFGICLTVECADELESIAVAFRVESTEFEHVPIILQAFQVGKWEPATQMPSRPLAPGEFAFELIHVPAADRDV